MPKMLFAGSAKFFVGYRDTSRGFKSIKAQSVAYLDIQDKRYEGYKFVFNCSTRIRAQSIIKKCVIGNVLQIPSALSLSPFWFLLKGGILNMLYKRVICKTMFT